MKPLIIDPSAMDKNSFDLKSARRSLSTFFLVLFLASSDMFAQEALPKGSHPPAIVFDHFPNRMFAFVWRNWNLVQPERMAKTIQCDVKDIFAIAASMGLPAASPVSEAFKKHSYITVLRRNWHLLPYDKLLTLLDMSSQSLEFALKEDDFLFHKFGNLKPACLPLAYSHPGEKAWARAREIKLSAVPWIPALDLVTEHAANLAKVDTDGFMLSWTLGGYPSPNLEVVQRFNDNPDADPDAVLQAVAVGRYGEKAAPFVRSAWTSFSSAFEEFPYDIRTLYSGPQQYGPANLCMQNQQGTGHLWLDFHMMISTDGEDRIQRKCSLINIGKSPKAGRMGSAILTKPWKCQTSKKRRLLILIGGLPKPPTFILLPLPTRDVLFSFATRCLRMMRSPKGRKR